MKTARFDQELNNSDQSKYKNEKLIKLQQKYMQYNSKNKVDVDEFTLFQPIKQMNENQ
jgi:hypothetical protein